MGFDVESLPNQRGRIAIVTGSNIGLGYQTALMLAQRGATVIMACRNLDKAQAARARITAAAAEADVEVLHLDLSSLASVREFATAFRQRYDRLDVLIHNAGIMWAPRGKTVDGFESTLGTNHLGPFLLTSLLIDLMPDTPASRVVTVASNAHKQGRINFDDLQSERSYSKMGSYAQSKLANVMFALELQRRLEASGKRILSVAAHPGLVIQTGLIRSRRQRALLQLAAGFLSNTAYESAKTSVLAALDPGVRGGEYYGPRGFMELKGGPGKVEPTKTARDPVQARRLWVASEEVTGAVYPLAASPAAGADS